MAEACVLVQSAPPQYDARDGLEFWHNFPMANSTAVTGVVRDVESENDFWSTHIVGVYEADEDWDWDGENRWHIAQSNLPIIIYEEVVRDLSVSTSRDQGMIERHIVLHGVLHRFLGPHTVNGSSLLTDWGNMDPWTAVLGDDAANTLSC